MTFNPATQSFSMQTKRTSFGHGSSANASFLIEKTKANMRRSTPDSEALASSDDEQEQQRLAQAASQQAQRSQRRASYLGENHGTAQRKSSMSSSDTFPSSLPHGTSAIGDTNLWTSPPTTLNRNSAATAAFPWANTIWNDSQKGPPARLTEVLAAPNNHRSSSFTEEPLGSPNLRQDSISEAAIPFAIPLHPTLKTYRSQSYSVGQLDQELVNTSARLGQSGHPGRTRAGSSYAGLQHRLSRPSMLGDFSPDTSILEQLREVDDDDETSTASSEAGVRLPGPNTRTMEQLAMENAILRQQAYANNASSTAHPAMASGVQFTTHSHLPSRMSGRSGQVTDSVVEEPDDVSVSTEDGPPGRGMARPSPPAFPGNRALESIKKGHWQTSLGFGGTADAPQSRRHSFADVPLRSNSRVSGGDARVTDLAESRAAIYADETFRQGHPDSTSYFSNPLSRPSELHRPASSSSSIHQAFNGSQPVNMIPAGHPMSQASQQLYLVTFKAARAEFYYVQDGTGLEVNAGDLVIVEADRGTDLGTVTHKNVDWASAKQLKERYVLEHFNWLMMFSRHGQSGQIGSPNSPATLPTSGHPFNGSNAGMGLAGHGSASDTTTVEIKPKMIKRLAQPHEIYMLRDKEGNEAKAKRMCQQKVAEHHLNMEILDAEFQMDWKKLTFYYYAEAYVNFNSLVTDLFKIYKTRIWMSAINPASFVSPTTGLQLASGSIASSIQQDRDRFPDARLKANDHGLSMSSLHTAGTDNLDIPWTDARTTPMTASMGQPAYTQYFQPQPHGFSSMGMHTDDFGRGLYSHFQSSSPAPFQQYSAPSNIRSVGSMTPRYADDADKGIYRDQLNALQGLSLGS